MPSSPVEFITLRVPPELKRWIEDEAERRGLSMNQTLVELLLDLATVVPARTKYPE